MNEYSNMHFSVKLEAFICDAPASFLKCVIDHGRYNACERCQIPRYYKCYRMLFGGEQCHPKRTDEEFEKREYIGTHQQDISPFSRNYGCVSSFVLD